MKNLKVSIALLLCIIMAVATQAQTGQNTKPKLFDNLPQIINCNDAALANIFATSTNQAIEIKTATDFTFSGVVTAKVSPYTNLQTAVVKSSVLDNAIFNIAKATNADGSIEYSGIIVNEKYFDGYELRKNTNGSYSLYKIETTQTLHNCNQ